MRNVVNAKITDEDMAWLREYIKENKPEMITRNNITKGYSLIRYVSVNPDTGASVHGSQFYGPNPTIKEVIKYGGVCGAMSKLGSVVAQAYGVPAFPVGNRDIVHIFTLIHNMITSWGMTYLVGINAQMQIQRYRIFL